MNRNRCFHTTTATVAIDADALPSRRPFSFRRDNSGARALTLTAAAAAAAAAAVSLGAMTGGCSSKDNFAKVNGQAISRDEYIRALERQQVVVPGGQPTNAERFVLDKLVGDKVVLAEAARNNVLPTDEDVTRMYEVQKKLWEANYPGKEYEKTMSEQGGSPEDIKADLRSALAETAVFAKKLNVSEDEVRKAYQNAKGSFGLPARVQLRMIVVAPNSDNFNAVQSGLKENKSFDELAKEYNVLPTLKANGGLMQQATPMQQVPPAWQAKVEQTADGKYFGPVDFGIAPNQPPVKAWVKVEKKLPALTLPYEDARNIVRRQLVQVKMADPKNANIRQELMKLKMDAKFEAGDKRYEGVWNTYKDAAKAAGLGVIPPGGAPAGGGGAAAPAPNGGAIPNVGAPAPGPKAGGGG